MQRRGLLTHRLFGKQARILPIGVTEVLDEAIVAEVDAALYGQDLRYLGLIKYERVHLLLLTPCQVHRVILY